MAKKTRPGAVSNLHQSYSGFTKGYRDIDGKYSSSLTRRRRLRTALKTALIAFAALLLVAVGFFVTDTLLAVSDLPPSDGSSIQTPAVTTAPATEPSSAVPTQPPKAALGTVHGLYADSAVLGGGSALESFIQKAKAQNANTALIDFKRSDGSLAFPCTHALAKQSNAAANAYQNAAQSIRTLQDNGIRVMARIFCYQDAPLARLRRADAVHYRQTDSLWLDNAADAGGQPWLNPYSAAVNEYLCALVSETAALGVDSILLDAVQFADGSAQAGFPGETAQGAKSRNQTLLDFVAQAKQAAGRKPLLCKMIVSAVLGTPSAQYGGSDLWNARADAFFVPAKPAQAAHLAALSGKVPIIPFAAERPDDFDQYIAY